MQAWKTIAGCQSVGRIIRPSRGVDIIFTAYGAFAGAVNKILDIMEFVMIGKIDLNE
jgi:hypothetical protein